MAEPESGFTIVRADLGHLDTLTPLFDGYRQFYKQPSDLAAAREYLKSRIEANACVIFLALAEDGAGLGFVLLYPTWDSVDLATYWILHDLFVDIDCRQRGAGTALMKTAASFGRSVGASRLDLGTGINNKTAQSLYESLGWKRDQEFYSYSLTLGGD
jgi:GNAT superfamily N-acetyltransferase